MTTQNPNGNAQTATGAVGATGSTPTQQTTADEGGTALRPGMYKKCRGIEESWKHGFSTKGTPEITLNVFIPELKRHATIVLYFSADAAKFSMERLRSMGWEGNDIRNLRGISTRDIDVEITYEMFEGKMRPKVQIMGGGTFETRNPAQNVDEWAARVQALMGGGPEGGGAPVKGGPDPDF